MTEQPDAARLREHPATRFGGPQHVFDLEQLSAHLQAEARPGASGHRQMTIFHHGATTMVLFAFESGGHLADHKANGLVTIYALDGALIIEAEGRNHELGAQQVLVLNPGVRHSVTAHAASRMLLTVHMEKGRTAAL